MIEEPLFYILAVVAILLVGISKSGFGSGIGVLGVPLMALVISPQQAAGIMLPLLCLMDIFNVWHYRRTFDGRNLRILIPAGLLGILLGSFTFRYLSDAHIRVLIGVISVLFVANFFFGKRLAGRQDAGRQDAGPGVLRGGFWGTVAGFVSFGVHAGGPPVNIYLLPQRLEKSLFVGTTVIFFAVVNYVKLVPYYFLDQLNPGNLTTSLVLAPLAPLGVWLGIKLHDRVNERLFYRLAYFFLLVTGVKLLWDGLKVLI